MNPALVFDAIPGQENYRVALGISDQREDELLVILLESIIESTAREKDGSSTTNIASTLSAISKRCESPQELSLLSLKFETFMNKCALYGKSLLEMCEGALRAIKEENKST